MKELCIERLAQDGYLIFDEIECEATCRPEELAMVISSFSSLGYALGADEIKKLNKLDSVHLTKFYNENYKVLENICGMNVKHKVFYKNFPRVENMSDLEVVVRAILHYITVSDDSDGFMSQDILDFEREVVHNPKKQMLKFISSEEAKKYVIKIVENIFEGKVAISYGDYCFIADVLEDYSKEVVINEIPFKENLAHYIKLLTYNKVNPKLSEVLSKECLRFIKTPTDLLRFYAAISNGDVTLRDNVEFISLERSVRRMLLEVLDEIAKDNLNIYDDLNRNEFLWKRAFEKLHVGEYKTKYPNIYEVAKKFRNEDYNTFYSKLNSLENNQVSYIKLLKTRPGEFARRLDMLIRKENYDLEYTLNEFKTVAHNISTTLLISLWEHFKNRNLYPTRIFKINKPHTTVFKEIPDERDVIDTKTISLVIKMIEEVLTEIYSSYEVKGKVYIDPDMKNYCLPRNTRNGSAQRKTLTYGTRIKLDPTAGSFIRVFTHFKNMKPGAEDEFNCRVDVDLSAEFVSDAFDDAFTLGWHNFYGGREFNSFISGDVTSAPEGASEFIDIDYQEARKYARYCIVCNSVYTGQDFADIPECFSGVMFMPEIGKEGEIFNPEFVELKFDLTQRGSNLNCAFVIDLETMELIWMDSAKTYDHGGIVAAASASLCATLKDVLKEHMNLYDFFMLHKGHIEIVDKIEDADIIVSDKDFATLKPYDVAIIAANWL